MKFGRVAVVALLFVGHPLTEHTRSAFAADGPAPAVVEQDIAPADEKTVAAEPTNVVKWYQLQNVTIPPDCALRSQDNITKPPAIFVQVKKDGKLILQSSVEKGWTVDYPRKKNVFAVDDPDAIYTVQVWDDCWWNQNICNITGLSSEAFARTIYQKGGQYDTKERLLSVQFREVPAP
jgi:hypothetical protein